MAYFEKLDFTAIIRKPTQQEAHNIVMALSQEPDARVVCVFNPENHDYSTSTRSPYSHFSNGMFDELASMLGEMKRADYVLLTGETEINILLSEGVK